MGVDTGGAAALGVVGVAGCWPTSISISIARLVVEISSRPVTGESTRANVLIPKEWQHSRGRPRTIDRTHLDRPAAGAALGRRGTEPTGSSTLRARNPPDHAASRNLSVARGCCGGPECVQAAAPPLLRLSVNWASLSRCTAFTVTRAPSPSTIKSSTI